MATVKEEIVNWTQTLPDDCAWEDVEYYLFLRAKLNQSIKDIEAGRVIPHEEVKRRMAEWLKSYGPMTP